MQIRTKRDNILFFPCICLHLCLIHRIIFAEGTDTSSTTSLDKPINIINSGQGISKTDTVMKEVMSTEAIWFGIDEEVIIATRHKTPISKAHSIVTIIFF
ncbi:MAG: hypothetical protein AAB013_05525 [Planctomycetota bacterium]